MPPWRHRTLATSEQIDSRPLPFARAQPDIHCEESSTPQRLSKWSTQFPRRTPSSLELPGPTTAPTQSKHVYDRHPLQVRRHRQPRSAHRTHRSPNPKCHSSKSNSTTRASPTPSQHNPSPRSSRFPPPNPPPTHSRKPRASRLYTCARSPPSPVRPCSQPSRSALRASDTRICCGRVWRQLRAVGWDMW